MLDLEDVVDRATHVANSVAVGCAEEADRGQWPERAIRALQVAGLGGLVVPRAAGGLGHGLLAVARVCEVLGRQCGSAAMCFGMHLVGSGVLAAKADADQTERYLGPIVRGQHVTTLALSEPGTGANFYLPDTKAHRLPDGSFRVAGTKSFVTNGGHADSYVISTSPADPDAPPGEFSCFVVPHDTRGLSFGEAWDGFGMRGNSSRVATLSDVTLPRRDLLGAEGDELWYLFNVIAPFFLMAMSGTYLGLAQAALDIAIAHVSARKHSHSGRALAARDTVRHRLGELFAIVERTRALIYSAAQKCDASTPDALVSVLSAKAEVADASVTVANEVMTLVGGIGYGSQGPLPRILRDTRAAHVMAPTTDILRIWTGRALLGLPLLGE